MLQSKPFDHITGASIQFPLNAFGTAMVGKLTVTANVRKFAASVGVVAQALRVDAASVLAPPPTWVNHFAQWDEVLLADSPQNPGASAGFSAICEIGYGTVLVVSAGFLSLDPGDTGEGSLSVLFEPLAF